MMPVRMRSLAPMMRLCAAAAARRKFRRSMVESLARPGLYDSLVILAAVLPLAIWGYLFLARGWFWRIEPFRASGDPSVDRERIAVVIPARDEAETIGRVVASWEAQEYGGPLRVILVDDHSSDGTGDLARAAMAGSSRFQLLGAPEKPPG